MSAIRPRYISAKKKTIYKSQVHNIQLFILQEKKNETVNEDKKNSTMPYQIQLLKKIYWLKKKVHQN